MYAILVMNSASAQRISGNEALILLAAAFLPFGAFFVGGIFRAKAISG